MLLPLIALLAACGPKAPPATALSTRADGAGRLSFGPAVPGLCLSAVPDAPRLSTGERAAVEEARSSLNEGSAPNLAGLPDHPATRVVEGALALMQGDAEGGRVVFRDLANAWPADPCLGQAAAYAALQAGRFEYAGPYLDTALKGDATDPDTGVLAAWAATQLRGDVDGALKALRVVNQAHPDNALARAWLGRIQADRGEFDLALPHLKAATAAGIDLGATLARAAWAVGDKNTWLKQLGSSPPLARDLSQEPDPMAALASHLGVGPGGLFAVLDTSVGELRCELFWSEAPVTVGAFVDHARGGGPWRDPTTGALRADPLYHNLIFHRVIPDFMVQTGDPLGNGTGGPGYRFADEISPTLGFDRPGRLAMANSGPTTNGSQFFITEVPVPHLSGRHTIFGQCDDSAVQVVKRLSRVPRNAGDVPLEPVYLHGIRIEAGAPGASPSP